MSWGLWAEHQLVDIRTAGRWRTTRTFDAHGAIGRLAPTGAESAGRSVVSFASNDYFGLSTHPAVTAAAHQAIDRWGTGATASRLIVGSRPCHDDLESEIADWKRCDRALVFPSGFAANLGVLGVFGGPGVTVFSDELNHASIIDGCRLSRSNTVIYPHLAVDQLDTGLSACAGRAIVVTDAIFSMDGDAAPLAEIASTCARHRALLVVDEAHSVFGPDVPALDGLDVVRVGTLSKALGALGGWAASSEPFIDLLVNRARSFIFTTALTPADTAAALAALRVLRSTEGSALVDSVQASTWRLRPSHPSPIVAILLGAESRAMDAAAALLERGVFVPAIRPPTVPPGTARLRIALSAAHTEAMLDQLVHALADLGLGA